MNNTQTNVETLVEEAERWFVSKKFRLACARALQALSLIVSASEQEQLLGHNLLNNLESLRQLKLENLRTIESEDKLNEQNCLAIIIQCLFELKQHDDAEQVLSSYYGAFENAPFEVQTVLVQMLIHLSKYDKAQEHINTMQNGAEGKQKQVLTDLSEHLLQRRTEGQKSSTKQKILSNLSITQKSPIHYAEQNIIDTKPSTTPNRTSLILPGYKDNNITWKNVIVQRCEGFIAQIRTNPQKYAKIGAVITAALFLCVIVLRFYSRNHSAISEMRIKTVQSIREALKMALFLV